MRKFFWPFLLLFPAGLQAQHLTPAPDGTEIRGAQAPARTEQAAQDVPTVGIKDLTTMSTDDFVNLHLPPLHVLLENARERSPQVNTFSAQQTYEERELKTIRRTWMRYIKLNSTFSYGTNDASSQIYYDNNPGPMVQNVTGTTQRWWNVGASITLPLEEIFNRRNKVKQQQSRVASIKYQVDNWYDNLCLQIIDCYTRAVQNLAVLGTVSRSMITAQAQYAAIESDFINGKIDAQVLARQKNVESEAVRQYHQTRTELTKALLELEILSKTPIISRPEEITSN